MMTISRRLLLDHLKSNKRTYIIWENASRDKGKARKIRSTNRKAFGPIPNYDVGDQQRQSLLLPSNPPTKSPSNAPTNPSSNTGRGYTRFCLISNLPWSVGWICVEGRCFGFRKAFGRQKVRSFLAVRHPLEVQEPMHEGSLVDFLPVFLVVENFREATTTSCSRGCQTFRNIDTSIGHIDFLRKKSNSIFDESTIATTTFQMCCKLVGRVISFHFGQILFVSRGCCVMNCGKNTSTRTRSR